MANTYLKAEAYIEPIVAELAIQERFGGLVTKFNGDRFVGARNDTLIYRTKGVTIARDYEFRTRTQPVIFDEIYRNELPVRIDKHMTVANRWTDEERKFDQTSIQTEIAAPMAEAFVERMDAKVKTAVLAADWAVTDLNISASDATLSANGKDPRVTATMRIKRKLDAVGTPTQGRLLVLGANALEWFVAGDAVYKYDPQQALTVFRQLVLGRIGGFEVVDGTDLLGDNDILALHRSWAVLANVAPELSNNLEFQAIRRFGGYEARIAGQYHLPWLSDALVLNSFWGVSEIKDQYARHTPSSANTANDGSSAGDIIIEDGRTKFTGKNARGGKGTFSA